MVLLELANIRAVLKLKAVQIMPVIDDVQMTLNLLGWICLQTWQGTIYCCSI